MPENVLFKKKSEALEYAHSMGPGYYVMEKDADGDGEIDGYVVVDMGSETEAGRGPQSEELTGKARTFQRAYLGKVEDAQDPKKMVKPVTYETGRDIAELLGDPEGGPDELGYRHGGMNFTKRGPVKYSKGGAIRGKTFRGNY